MEPEPDKDSSGFQPMAATSGVLLVLAGTIAAITGQFETETRWLFAVSLAMVGFVGLVSAVTGALSASAAA